MEARLLKVYRLLYHAYGPRHWWPGDTPFEIIVGAILTQSAAWGNVEKAIRNLKEAGALSPQAIRRLPDDELARLVFPSGYYNAKAAKLKAFVRHMEQYDDDLDRLFAQDVQPLRRELLGIYGIGEETADSIILYAAGQPSFVIDAYTRRIVARLGIAPRVNTYLSYQALFAGHLAADADLFNEYHALLVDLGKRVCRKRPLCSGCPLLKVCPTGQENLTGGG